MADLTQKYINKKKPKPTTSPIVVIPTTSKGLHTSDLKSDIPGKSATVRKAGGILQHIDLKNVCDWYIDGIKLVINQVDSSIPIILEFQSFEMAIAAEIRFTGIKNGGIFN